MARRWLGFGGSRRELRDVELEQVYRMRRAHVVPVRQPLALVSQVNRSGGTLLAQLFSGHPQCHVHPGEIQIGFPSKEEWPDFDLGDAPERWFAMLLEKRIGHYAREGFIKVPERLRGSYATSEISHPFLFVPSLQRQIFDDCIAAQPPRSQRDVIDAYMTSYFNAWLDYQGLYAPGVRWVVGFVPRLASRPDSLERFFRDYPDGRLISIVRDPRSWFVSWQRKKPEERQTPETGLPRWKASAQAMLDNKRRFGERVRLLRFDRLLQQTEASMRSLAAWLGIEFHEILTRPTFQSIEIRANSSDRVERTGILDAPLLRSGQLPEAHVEAIRAEAGDLYARVLAAVDREGG